MADPVGTERSQAGPAHALAPLMVVVLVAFAIIGMAMPVLPLHVHQNLGLGTVVVGLVTSSQFAASLVSRIWSGHCADRQGPKRAVVIGLLSAAVAGSVYLLSLGFTNQPALSATVLILGRAILGGAESFIITGALSWGVARVGQANTGRVMSWMGTAMYAAFAGGAPIGTQFFASGGFAAISVATMTLPLVTLLLVLPLPAAPPRHHEPLQLTRMARAVWVPGLGLALASLGFGALTAFVSLLFAERFWEPVWPAFTVFALAFMAARIGLGHLPDRLGGAKVALISIVIEAVGLLVLWLAPNPHLAFAGAAATGLGYSLVYPALGVEAVARAPKRSHGLAMGTYTAFLDLALGIAGPVLGWLASAEGMGAVFWVSAVIVLCSAGPISGLLRPRIPSGGDG